MNYCFSRSLFILLLTIISTKIFGQCEGLQPDKTRAKHWKEDYNDYFESTSTVKHVKADSVLMIYLSSSKTDYDVSCSYREAEKFAVKELNKNVQLLTQKLKGLDKLRFQKSQAAWQNFYNLEWEFTLKTFSVYSNENKYLLGTQENVKTPERKYNIIRQRILSVSDYLEILSN